jgi:translation initiation factor IF-3
LLKANEINRTDKIGTQNNKVIAIRNSRGYQPRVEKKDAHRINNFIRGITEVRLVGENIEPGVFKLTEALRLADQFELDLVEISPNAEPPVCKIMDYKKFVYMQKKRDKELKAKSTQITVKEIRFGPQTDEHDYEFKRKNAEKFLKEGSKLKAFVFFKGRSIIYKDQGQILLLRLATDLEEFGKVEAMPVLEGKRMIMFIAPKKKK